MTVQDIALAHYRRRSLLVRQVERVAAVLWRRVDPVDIAASWAALVIQLLVAMIAAQRAAARQADSYLAAVLAAQGLSEDGEGLLIPAALSGIASDGRPLESLLMQPVITAKTALSRGASTSQALAAGQAALEMIAATQIADSGRVADSVAMTARPQVGGYVRMVVGRTCGRCVVLAGRWYRWNTGFARHPRCDCVHIPSREAISGDLRTHPRAFFDSLSEREQNRQFTTAGAQAIRDGADIAQVVNARRGAYGLTPAGARITASEAERLRGGRERGRLTAQTIFGQQLLTTTEGTTTRGIAGRALGARETGVQGAGDRYRRARAPRLMPESIYQIATDRADAIRLLRRNGYIR